jgi:hypothetical protein
MATQARAQITLEQLGLSASVDPMQLTFRDDWFEFPGYFKKPAHTQIEVYSRSNGGYSVVIATELDNNDGVSITNGSESLAMELCRKLIIKPTDLILVEHYGADYGADQFLPEHWDLVRFSVGHPGKSTKNIGRFQFGEREWFPLDKSQLERLLGMEL